MGLKHSSLGSWALLAATLGLAACVTPPLTSLPEDQGLARKTAVDTIAAGYANLVDKYIEPVSIHRIALDGLNGIRALDPLMGVAEDDGKIELRRAYASSAGPAGRSYEVVKRFTLPSQDDAASWAELTVDVYAAGRRSRSDLSRLSMDRVYQAVFDGAVSDLDPFTRYLGTTEAERARNQRDGFGGLGFQYVVQNGMVRITLVLPETPAEAAGIKDNDQLTHIDGEATADMSLAKLAEVLRGRIGSTARLSLTRPGKATPIDMTLVRALIVPRTVAASRKDNVLILKVSGFNQNTAHAFGERIREAEEKPGAPLKGVVVDLRGNPGGLLNQAIRMADFLIEKGDIVNTRGRNVGSFQHYEATGRILAKGLPVVVLVDERSASSSEVLTAALQDQHRAVVIGTTSYGKGTVQTVIRLPNDGEMTLTWSRLITPSGYALHGLGIHPTVCTSGLKGPQAVLPTVPDTHEMATAVAWRQVAVTDSNGRDALRKSCPAEIRNDDTEVNLALRLIADRSLYDRYLGVAPTVEAKAEADDGTAQAAAQPAGN
jgi:carboxyl-terminal processing protease